MQKTNLSKNEPNSTEFVLYPNPTNGNIKVISNYINKIKLVEMYSVQGEKVLEIEVKEGIIDITKLKAGIYVVKSKVDNRVLSSKVIIE